ncbi:hypothetical protein Ccar_24230 [Clostridium carboxidivorans P7]|uniref:Uncharacterized protein n=1 Tax=Clostridium carboxidivorans P7 TaxID=536227 RepID=C6Q107_9CLOT|nr:hypothetical protein [Clostridium carboxidivorans]AKN33763.1 hypothetical protein Ccar_24230 [Clostridium carboxidivorans P7]EET84826.1 hypothetical protein CcarbDRAFT_4724 [Clostridium carboxidivorans P7]EFG86631.1 hypothetical protein CLCAR_3581 [Clostridium carboxidivorans P7]
MEKNIYEEKEFVKSDIFNRYSNHNQEQIKYLITLFKREDVDFIIKLRKDNAIAFAMTNNVQRNILTIWIYEKHLRVQVFNILDKKIYTINDFDDSFVEAVLEKFNSYCKSKKQISLYINEDVLQKTEQIALKEGKKTNDIIAELLENKIKGIYINRKHKREFLMLLKQLGIYNETAEEITINDKYRRLVSFIYLISQYQDIYKEQYGQKFYFDRNLNTLNGPINNQFNNGTDAELILNLAFIILKDKESSAALLLELLQNSISDTIKLFIIINAIKILSGRYKIVKEELVEYEKIRNDSISLDDLLK